MTDKYSGLVILDKPTRLTSFDCVEKVRDIFNVKKAGHTGTLDPKVTGVLLILIGEARKLSPLFEKMDKTYIGVMHLHGIFSQDTLKEVIKKFEGEIIQTPPKKSRVKRVPRKRKIYKIEILEINGNDVKLLIRCQHGTYIRKLFHDIGVELGCGAHMKFLRRIAVNGFTEEESVDLEKLKLYQDKYLIKNEEIIERLDIKKLVLTEEYRKKVENGLNLENKDFSDGELVAIFIKDKFLAYGYAQKEKIKIKRVLKIMD